MIHYIKGSLLLLFFISLFYLLGTSMVKDNKYFYKNCIIGYIAYSFLIALFLIPVQVLKMSWIFVMLSVILVLVLCIFFIFYRFRKYKIRIFNQSFKVFLKENYFLFLISIALFLIYLLQFDLLWINNHLDDGYYLLKVANLPYIEDPFSVMYPTGFLNSSASFDPYLLSVHESEAAVYAYLFGIDVNVYCKFVLNVLNYFLAASTITWLAKEVLYFSKKKVSQDKLQYFSMILLVFSFEYLVLQYSNILNVQDSWQFNSAMWYGSSIVRVLGLLWIVLPFLNSKKIGIKEILGVFAICFMLMSKSSIAVSVIYATGISYLIVFYFGTPGKYNRYIGIGIVSIICMVGLILPNVSPRDVAINDFFIANRFSFLIWGSLLMMILGYFYIKSFEIKRMICILFVTFLLIVLPQVNDIFENISFFDFVARRAQTTLIYSLLALAFIIFLTLIYDKFKVKDLVISLGLFITLFSLSVISTIPVYGNPLNTYKIMYNNNKLMPESTVQLSKKLNEYSKGKELNVIAPEWIGDVGDIGNRHSLAVVLRVYAPNIKSLSTIGRYSAPTYGPYKDFSSLDQATFNDFLSNPNFNTFEAFNSTLNKYPINCVITTSDAFEEYLQFTDFKLVDRVEEYRIYLNENI